MNILHIRRLNAFDAVIDLLGDHPIAPAIPRITALETQVSTVATSLRTHAAAQIGGDLLFRSGVSSRAELRRELRSLMQPINRVARALDREAHPGVRDQFRMPADHRIETLIGTARAFVAALSVASVKTLFTDRGLAATFDADLSAKVDELVAITDVKNSGFQGKIGATEGIATSSATGLKAMRELESILQVVWKNDPVLLAELRSVCRIVRRLPQAQPAPATPVPPAAPAEPAPVGSGAGI